jgi:hypothetical protein
MTHTYNMWCALINVYKINNLVESEAKDLCSESGYEQELSLTLTP